MKTRSEVGYRASLRVLWSVGQLKMIRGTTQNDPWANSKWSVGQLKMIRDPTQNDPWDNSKWSVGQRKMIRGPTQNDPWANSKWSVGQQNYFDTIRKARFHQCFWSNATFSNYYQWEVQPHRMERFACLYV